MKEWKWISVDDWLPEESGYYLVAYDVKAKHISCQELLSTLKDNKPIGVGIVEWLSREKLFESWVVYNRWHPPCWSLNKWITHWMPLPDLPYEK